MRNLALVLSLFLLVSCDREDMIQKFSSPEAQAAARGYIDRLRARDFDAIEKAADASIRGPTLRATMEQMSAMIPSGEPTLVKVVGAQSFAEPGKSTVNTTFEYDFDGKWLLINVAIKTEKNAKTIVGFNVIPEPRSLDDQNKFTLSGKAPIQYGVLVAAIVAGLLSLGGLVVCIRTELPRRKWLWILFILFGLGRISVNWTTAQWTVMPLAFQLFSASAMAPLYGPWWISASLPLGAIVFLIYRRTRSPPAPAS